MNHQRFEQLLRDLAAFCAARGVPAWLVGGAARDLALGRPSADLDLAVDGDGLALARAFADVAGAAFVPLDDERRTGRVVIPGGAPLVADIAALRAPTIEGDLRLRDFTLNALALSLEGNLSLRQPPSSFLDPTGGLSDLRAGVLRAAGPTSLADDPLRVLRAARLMAALGLRLAPELPAALAAAAPGLARVAAERVRDELLKLLDATAAAPALRALAECGALTQIIPELEPSAAELETGLYYRTVLEHLLETVAALDWLVAGLRGEAVPPGALPLAARAVATLSPALPYAGRLGALLGEARAGGHSRAALLKFAALLHDIAKPETAERQPDGSITFYGHQEIGAERARVIARRLRVSRADTGYVYTVVREHMRPGQLRTNEVITLRAVARFFRDLGDAGPDVLVHELADHLATRGPTTSVAGWANHLAFVEAMLAQLYEPPPERTAPLLDGRGLMEALGIRPGPLVGALLRSVGEAQAAGEITTREEALALARQELAERRGRGDAPEPGAGGPGDQP
jgi:poly(A) polymerase/tRNA nucleotidyltransferase (CCA-adding enzyme)